MYTFTIIFNGIWVAFMLAEKYQNPMFDVVTVISVTLLIAVIIIQYSDRDHSRNLVPMSEYWRYLACGSNEKYILYSNVLSCVLFCVLFGITVLELRGYITFVVGTLLELLTIPAIIRWLKLSINKIPKNPKYVLDYANKHRVSIQTLAEDYATSIVVRDELRFGYDYVFIENRVMKIPDIRSCEIVIDISFDHPFCFYKMILKTDEDTIEVYSVSIECLTKFKRMVGK